jgi:hypothetical protein
MSRIYVSMIVGFRVDFAENYMAELHPTRSEQEQTGVDTGGCKCDLLPVCWTRVGEQQQ